MDAAIFVNINRIFVNPMIIPGSVHLKISFKLSRIDYNYCGINAKPNPLA